MQRIHLDFRFHIQADKLFYWPIVISRVSLRIKILICTRLYNVFEENSVQK
jgi:hypothetical protein